MLKLLTQLRDVAVVGCVNDEGFVGEGGEFGGDAAFVLVEIGEDQQATVGQGLLPFRRRALGQGARGADDDGLLSAQEDAQTLFFHRGMKTADDATTGITAAGGLIVAAEDGITGTAGGTEKRGFGQREQVQIAEDGQFWRGVRAQTPAQARGIFRCNCFNLMNIHKRQKIWFATSAKMPIIILMLLETVAGKSCTLVCSESRPRALRGASLLRRLRSQ